MSAFIIQGFIFTILGLTFKVTDLEVNVAEALEAYNVQLIKENKLEPSDAVIFAVPYKLYLEKNGVIVNENNGDFK